MIDLFILETCPYCKKVMDFLNTNNLEYNKIDVSDQQNIQKLLSLGGKEQVPFLFDHSNNRKIYESKDIIEYISKGH